MRQAMNSRILVAGARESQIRSECQSRRQDNFLRGRRLETRLSELEDLVLQLPRSDFLTQEVRKQANLRSVRLARLLAGADDDSDRFNVDVLFTSAESNISTRALYETVRDALQTVGVPSRLGSQSEDSLVAHVERSSIQRIDTLRRVLGKSSITVDLL